MAVEKWGQDPAMNAKLVSINQQQRAAEDAREKAIIMAALASVEVMEKFQQIFRDGPDELLDVNEWIRIGEILLSRAIPKVAAKHAQDNPNTVETADVAALRESILNEIQKRR